MDNSTIFGQAVLCRPPVILGRQMRPFSAYHGLALSVLDSPFFASGTASTEDVIVAVWVCGTAWGDGGGLRLDGDGLDAVMDWGRTVGQFEVATITDALTSYMDDYMTVPRMMAPSGASSSHVPVYFKLVATFLAHYSGFTEADAWNLPFNRLCCYLAARAEDNGSKLMTDEQKAVLERIDALGLKWQPPAAGSAADG